MSGKLFLILTVQISNILNLTELERNVSRYKRGFSCVDNTGCVFEIHALIKQFSNAQNIIY